MKPKNLQSPFLWKERHVLIHDKIWYVPEHCSEDTYHHFSFPGWEPLFGNKNPIKIEYCSGNGAWIADRADQEPTFNWIAIERKFDRVRKIWSKIKNRNINNLLIICGEGHNITRRYFPAQCIEEVFINFPDPWPKKRHAKNRIIQMPFVSEIFRILKSRGKLMFVTDDPAYSDWTVQVMQSNSGFVSIYEAPFYVTEHSQYGTSYFEQLWREKGKSIRYHQFCKEI